MANQRSPWRRKLHEIIFEADTPEGRAFDLVLLLAIGVSVFAVSLESVASVRAEYGDALRAVEWVLTILFTAEYVLRLACVDRPIRYAVSFFGIVDLLSVLPTYLSLFFFGTQSLAVVRALRLLRVFRILKLAEFVGEARVLGTAIRASQRKIIIFLGTVMTLVLIIGAAMYLIEGGENGFTSIPQGMYWAIVTLTTVGYGDISPGTPLGKFFAAVVMFVGYGIIAVPTGIVTSELTVAQKREITSRACPACTEHGHDADARFCKYCGSDL